MANEGYMVDTRTLQVLLNACANYGDVQRGRLVWNEFVSLLVGDGEKDPIDERVVTAMFKVYSMALFDYGKGKRWPEDIASTEVTAETPSETAEEANSLATVDDEFPFLPTANINLNVLMEEADKIWKVTQTRISQGKMKASSTVLDSYLTLLCSIPRRDSTDKALQFFKEAYLQHRQSYTGHTFTQLIHLISKNKQRFESDCIPVFEQFLEWDKEQEEKFNVMEFKPSPLERESIREKQGRGLKSTRSAFLCIVRGYARLKNVDAALQTLENALKFRSRLYFAPPTLKEINNLVELCTSLADKGDWEPLKKMMVLCPKPNDPLKPVKDALGQKVVPKNWWGFDVYGRNNHLQTPKRTQEMRQKRRF
jgi:hypothetical protein